MELIIYVISVDFQLVHLIQKQRTPPKQHCSNLKAMYMYIFNVDVISYVYFNFFTPDQGARGFTAMA